MKRLRQNRETPEVCPLCGADVPVKAAACPECGADERTGWSEQARSDGLGLPDEEFDYDSFVRREFGGQEPQRPRHRFWWWVALGVAVAFIWLVVGGGFLG